MPYREHSMECLREDNIASPAPLAASATLPSGPEKIIVPYGTILFFAAGPLVDLSPCSSMSGVTPPRRMDRGRLFF